jgi:hypothetical protein
MYEWGEMAGAVGSITQERLKLEHEANAVWGLAKHLVASLTPFCLPDRLAPWYDTRTIDLVAEPVGAELVGLDFGSLEVNALRAENTQ